MSEIKAVCAQRATQSFKHIFYRYIEDQGGQIIHKLTKFGSTMSCHVNRSIGKSPRDIKNTDFFSFL